MKKLYNRENLDQLISMVNVDLLSVVQNVEYREEIKEILKNNKKKADEAIFSKKNQIF